MIIIIIRHNQVPTKLVFKGRWQGGVSTLRYDMAEHFHDSIVRVEIILRFREVRGRRPANHGTIIRRSARQVVR